MAGAPLLLTTTEVAELLQVHPKHVYRLIKRGLPATRVGGEWRFDRIGVMAWAGHTTAYEGATETIATPTTAALVAANGDVAVELLVDHVNASRPPWLGFVRADRDRALAMLSRGEVLLAGSHGRGFPRSAAGVRLARIHLLIREVGLVAARGDEVPTLAQLDKKLAKQTFAYRPQSAAIVVHFERAVAKAKLDLAKLVRRATLFDSHQAVAAAVASGRAQVGLTTHAWAHRLGLEFRALASESYGLLVRATDLGDPLVVRVCEAAQSSTLRTALAEIPGYDPTDIGSIRYDIDDAEHPAA
jgi:excisionase family DNA binding protein